MRPDNILGEPVPINLLLARSPKAAVSVQHVTAFPNGFELRVVARCRPNGELWDPMHGLAGFRGRPGVRGGEMSDEILRFGIQFADGSKATSLGPPMIGPTDKTQKGPILQPAGGASGGSVAEMTFWVWPLPPAGALVFVCEWPKYRIPLTRKEVDASIIRDAAKRAIELWPDVEAAASGPAGWSGYAVSTLAKSPKPAPKSRRPGGKGTRRRPTG